MRTTLILDPDVSAGLEELRRQHGLSLKDAVNQALRHGIHAMAEGTRPRPMFKTASVSLGLPRVPLDNVAEALAVADDESFR
jgi:hypothetical protein